MATASSAASPFRAHSMTPDRLTAEAVAEQLQLDGHVEGGFFRRTYASDYRLLTPGVDERLDHAAATVQIADHVADVIVGCEHVNLHHRL